MAGSDDSTAPSSQQAQQAAFGSLWPNLILFDEDDPEAVVDQTRPGKRYDFQLHIDVNLSAEAYGRIKGWLNETGGTDHTDEIQQELTDAAPPAIDYVAGALPFRRINGPKPKGWPQYELLRDFSRTGNARTIYWFRAVMNVEMTQAQWRKAEAALNPPKQSGDDANLRAAVAEAVKPGTGPVPRELQTVIDAIRIKP